SESVASNKMCQWSGTRIQLGAANTVTGAKSAQQDNPEISFTYVDASASANGLNPLYYSVCSSTLSNIPNTPATVVRIDLILSEVSAASDIAELYPTAGGKLENGDIVSEDATLINGVKIATNANDAQAMGVVSTRPSQIVGGVTPGTANSAVIALNGRVPVKVTTLNGDIASGSAITTSSLPGFGMNQTQPGTIVGRALESTGNWNTSTCSILDDWSQANSRWPYDDGTNSSHPCYAAPTNTVPHVPASYTQPYVYFGKVMMKVDKGFNIPDIFTSQGQTQITLGSQIPGTATDSASQYFLTDTNNNILTNQEAFSSLTAANGTFGSLNANELTAATISAQTLNMNGVTINGTANGISFTNSSNQPIFSLDNGGNATLSGQLTVGSLKLANGMISSDSLGNIMEQLATDSNNNNPTQFNFQNSTGKKLLSLDSNGNATLSGTLTTSVGNYDVAEDYPTKDHSIEAGDILSIDQTNDGHVQKSTNTYDKTILGVFSEKPGFRLSEGNGMIDGDKAVPVALTGRVPVKVSLENGPIHKGDYLTSSSVPGVAMRATQPGQVLGKALEDFNCATSPIADSCTGKVMAFVNVTFADPNNVLATAVTFHDQLNSLAVNVHDQINALAIQVKDNTDQITHINTAIDQLLKFAASFHDQVNNEANQIADLNNKVNNLSNVTPTPAPNSGFEATASATLQSQNNEISNLKSQIATLSGNTNNPTIIPVASSEAIFGFSTLSDQISDLQKQVLAINMANELSSQDATISGTFNVFGKTTVQELGVTGNITAGVMTIQGLDQAGQASINTVGDLKLQDHGAGGIDILNGKIKIDKNGNLFSKGEITVKKVNIDTSDVKAASLGTLTIKAGDTFGIATTSALTKNSKIFATPVGTPVALSAKKSAKNSLIINISEPQSEDIKVNWWIVN
ncbi:MAG TPA: hypothetical protein VLF93_02275, partial [Candidatus Saccharimonadales bacterium]|nr:hypothetical protein [Candidatus Saccharimonadales bacterium]